MSEPITAGTQIGNYRVVGQIGSGAMGEVYEAEHVHMGRRAAIKVLHAELVRNPTVARRFELEARAINAVGHPNTIEVSDAGMVDGRHYMVMELLQGETLEARVLRQTRLEVGSAVHIALQIADALALAHERGVVHRDIKPDNIFLITRGNTDDHVKILDFGVAKLVGAANGPDASVTIHGMVVGTPKYMSPEQCQGDASVDQRTDVYSLGVVLYRTLTGQLPWQLDNVGFMRIVMAHVNEPPTPPRQLLPALSPKLERVLLKMLAKLPADRYPDMRAVKLALASESEYPSAAPRASARAAASATSMRPAARAAVSDAPQITNEALTRMVIGGIHSGKLPLPVMPAAAAQCLQLLRLPEPPLNEVVRILGRDPIVAPQVIAGANVALFGGASRAKSLDQAVFRLGVRALTSLLLQISTRTLFESRDAEIRKSFQALWDHSVAVAVVSGALASSIAADAETAYLAGLLHDVGKPVTAAVLLEAERVSKSKAWHSATVWVELIEDCHRQVGFALARAWSLPDEVLVAIARSDRYSLEASATPVNVVCLANALVKRAGICAGRVDAEHMELQIAEGMRVLSITQAAVDDAMSRVQADKATQQTLLGDSAGHAVSGHG